MKERYGIKPQEDPSKPADVASTKKSKKKKKKVVQSDMFFEGGSQEYEGGDDEENNPEKLDEEDAETVKTKRTLKKKKKKKSAAKTPRGGTKAKIPALETEAVTPNEKAEPVEEPFELLRPPEKPQEDVAEEAVSPSTVKPQIEDTGLVIEDIDGKSVKSKKSRKSVKKKKTLKKKAVKID